MKIPIIIITTVVSSEIISKKNIFNVGKVVWVKPPIGKSFNVSLTIMLDGINFIGIDFLAVLLHKCRHIKDHGNPNMNV